MSYHTTMIKEKCDTCKVFVRKGCLVRRAKRHHSNAIEDSKDRIRLNGGMPLLPQATSHREVLVRCTQAVHSGVSPQTRRNVGTDKGDDDAKGSSCVVT